MWGANAVNALCKMEKMQITYRFSQKTGVFLQK